jgi:hypothetical protein
MRPLLAVAVSVVILGGMALYMQRRPQTGSVVVERKAEGVYSLEITLSFDAGPDEFALSADDQPSVLVKFRDSELLKLTDRIPAGEPIVIERVEGIVAGPGAAGRNEFYVAATPAESGANVSRALRVRVLRDGEPVADQSLWSEPGWPVQGTVELHVVADHAGAPHDDH